MTDLDTLFKCQLRKSQIGKKAGIEWGRGQKCLETDEDLPPVKLLV